MSGRSLAACIPKDCRFACDDILIERGRGRVILTPRSKSWREYFPYSTRFSDNFPIEDRPPGKLKTSDATPRAGRLHPHSRG